MSAADDARGVAFPFRIDPATGGVAVTEGKEKVMQNVRVLLATRVGERPLLREYGSRLPGLVHDPNDDVLADLAVQQTRDAIVRWEQRVVPADVSLDSDPDDGTVQLQLVLTYVDEQLAGRLTVPLV